MKWFILFLFIMFWIHNVVIESLENRITVLEQNRGKIINKRQ